MAAENLTHRDYTIGWVCALAKEQTAAQAMLDDEHPDLSKPRSDHNVYTLGSVCKKNIVIACLPAGKTGNNSSTKVAAQMVSTFPSIKFCLMMGIGGGVPPTVRLGDVVVSKPGNRFGGVVQWDFGKAEQGGKFQRTGSLSQPPDELLTTLQKLESKQAREGFKIPHYLMELGEKWPLLVPKYLKSDSLEDILFKSTYDHVDKPDDEDEENEEDEDEGSENICAHCDRTHTVRRRPPNREMKVHLGLIASGNQVIKNALERNKINKDLGGDVLCFEMEAAGLMNGFPCIVIRGICDYCDSHKNKDWQEHAAAVAAAYAKEFLSVVPAQEVAQMTSIKDIKDIKDFMSRQEARGEEEDKQKLLKWLSPRPSLERQESIAKNTFPTDKWLLESHEFKIWAEGLVLTQSRPHWLWCYGDSGVGKTVLASRITQNLRMITESQPALVLSLLMNSEKMTIEDLLGSLVKQAIEHQAGGIRSQKLKHMFEDLKKEKEPCKEDLFEALKEECNSKNRVYLIIDGWESIFKRKDLEEHLEELTYDSSKVSILVFSATNEEDLAKTPAQCTFCGKMDLKIYFHCQSCDDDEYFCEDDLKKGSCKREGHKMIINDDIYVLVKPEDSQIRQYVEWKMSEMTRSTNRHKGTRAPSLTSLERSIAQVPELKELIPVAIAKRSRGNFRWAKEYTEGVISMPTPSDIAKCLTDLPKDLSGVESKMKDFKELKQEKLMMCLCWITKSQRQLTFPALQHAIAVEPNVPKIDKYNFIDKEWLIAESDGIVRIGSDDMVSMDSTMYECLHEKSEIWFKDEQSSQMAISLLTYLDLDEFRQPCAGDVESDHDDRFDKMPLLEYASQYWADHVKPCYENQTVKTKLPDFLTHQGNIESCIQAAYKASSRDLVDFDIRTGANGLHLAAFYGFEDAVVNLIEKDIIDVNSFDPEYEQTALMYAARRGNAGIVKTLLKYGANTQKWSLRGTHALFEAYLGSYGGKKAHSETTMIILQDSDLNVNLRYPHEANRTLLMLASCRGDEDTVRYILRNHGNVDVNAQDEDGYTALLLAVKQTSLGVVKLLLHNSRTRVDLRQNQDETALGIAQDSEIVDMLLADRLMHPLSPGDANTALFKAVEQNKLSKITALLSKVTTLSSQSIPVRISDKHQRTLLHAAAYYGNVDILRFLLNDPKEGLNKNSQADGGATPLHEASRMGKLRAVRMLLDANADRNLKDKSGRTPLMVARQNAWLDLHHKIIHKLDDSTPTGTLSEQVTSNAATLPTWSLVYVGPSSQAEQRLKEKSGWDFHDRCPDTGNGALHFAAKVPRRKLLELLLQDKSDQRVCNFKKQTPLHVAVETGNFKTVKILLNYPPCPLESKDEYGRRPLKLAQETGFFAIAVALLEAGSDVDPYDHRYLNRTFLEAVKQGSATVAKILLEHGADHLRPGADGISALTIAHSHRDEEMLSILYSHRFILRAPMPSQDGALLDKNRNDG